MKTAYIAGPMSSCPAWNFPAFDAAEAMWRAEGWNIVSPARIDRMYGITEERPQDQGLCRWTRRMIILRDVVAILDCDAVVVLPGWQDSKGCQVEVSLARFIGISVLDSETGEEITT